MQEKITIAIPMAGFGTRLRPHTWSKPKPLVKLAGRTALDFALDQFNTIPDKYDVEFVFIVGNQGEQIKAYMDENHPQKTVHYVEQKEMKGQSHALYQAKEYLNGPMIMAFSDTLIEIDLGFLETEKADGIAVVKKVPDPRRFGAAKIDENKKVTGLVEKPQDMSLNLVVVGFYYFKSGEALMKAIEEQMSRNITLKNEYFLADAINIMIEKGADIRVNEIETWLDAGTPQAMFETNRYYLEHGHANTEQIDLGDSVSVIPPVFIDPTAVIKNAVIGPYVSVGANSKLENVVLQDTIIGDHSTVEKMLLKDSLIGTQVTLSGKIEEVNIGDDSWISSK